MGAVLTRAAHGGTTHMVAAVIFDFDGVVFDSETALFESHRRIYERCGATLTVDDWCDHIGLWVDGHEERWYARLRSVSAVAPDWPEYQEEERRTFQDLAPAEPMRHPGAARHARPERDPSSDRVRIPCQLGPAGP